MKTIQKRLAVVNDGWTERKCAPARTRIRKVVARYLRKMRKKGWKYNGRLEGNAFSQYEAIVYMYK